jgi:hypothetical protein
MSVAVVALGALAAPAQASTIFDLSPTNGTTSRGSDSGPGQGVSVSTTTTITGFSFYANLPGGGDAQFMIWDGTNSTLLFDQADPFAASGTPNWIGTSGNINFTLDAGNTYWFGIIADSPIDVGYIFPPVAYSSNGLSAVTTGNVNYITYAVPTFDPSNPGSAEIGLQISGSTSAIPEPSTWAMGLAGFAFIAALGWRRNKSPRFIEA